MNSPSTGVTPHITAMPDRAATKPSPVNTKYAEGVLGTDEVISIGSEPSPKARATSVEASAAAITGATVATE